MFNDRIDAGRQLAGRLSQYGGAATVVVGLPRGGVPVAYEVARALKAPLDILVVRKLGAPMQRELGMGAVAEGDVRFVDPRIVRDVGASSAELAAIIEREEHEVARRVARWRGATKALPLEGRTVIVVDDGIATGGTVRAALDAIRAKRPRRIVLAVPVAPTETLKVLARAADQIVCLEPVDFMRSIGEWYEDFAQVEDEQVAAILSTARAELASEQSHTATAPRPD